MQHQQSRLLAAVLVLLLGLILVACESGQDTGTRSGGEDSNAKLDALVDKDPSAMSDEMMSSGGWLGRATVGGTDYRVYEVIVDGSRARLYYKAVGGQGGGLALYMYDVEPFQLGE